MELQTSPQIKVLFSRCKKSFLRANLSKMTRNHDCYSFFNENENCDANRSPTTYFSLIVFLPSFHFHFTSTKKSTVEYITMNFTGDLSDSLSTQLLNKSPSWCKSTAQGNKSSFLMIQTSSYLYFYVFVQPNSSQLAPSLLSVLLGNLWGVLPHANFPNATCRSKRGFCSDWK